MVDVELRTLVVDDEPLARQRIVNLLQEESQVTVLGEAVDGFSALEALERLKPNLVFMDVRMPELSGFEVIQSYGSERMPAVVLITAHSQHALHAFDVQAIDYLLKPYDKQRFSRSVARARLWLAQKQQNSNPPPPAELGEVDNGQKFDRLLVRQGENQVLIRASEIQWLEAEDNYVRLHVAHNSYLLRQTLSGLLGRLDALRFRRIHRSYAINLDYVKHFEPWVHGDMVVVMTDGSRLTLSRTHRHCLRDLA